MLVKIPAFKFCLLFIMIALSLANDVQADSFPFSRLIIYDVRGINRDESSMIIEKKNDRVTIWYRNYLGQRQGSIPVEVFDQCFSNLLQVKKYALRENHRGKSLRRNAAKGSITLAWQTADGDKQIKTIAYYAPENTLDEFRVAFNQCWSLSRFAILSLRSLESDHLAFREDAIRFMSGSGWMTREEIKSVLLHQQALNQSDRVARAVWETLNQPFSEQSEFNQQRYLHFCIKKSMLAIGTPAATYLKSKSSFSSNQQADLANEIIHTFESTQN